MRKWEVKRVSGQGFIKDPVIKAYGNLDKWQVEDIKLLHKPRAVGTMEELLLMEHLLPKAAAGTVTEADMDEIHAGVDGKPFSVGTVYVIVFDVEDKGEQGQGGATAAAGVKKFVQQKIEDKVVQAEGDKLFKAGGASAEARKNIAQSERVEGGVWGAKRKGSPRG